LTQLDNICNVVAVVVVGGAMALVVVVALVVEDQVQRYGDRPPVEGLLLTLVTTDGQIVVES
jgi:hypothetical protein